MTSSTISSAPSRRVSSRRPVKIARRGRDAAGIAHHRLENHGGDLIRMGVESGFDCGKVVKGQRMREARDLLGHAGRAGNAERGHTGTRFHQQAIRVAVIAAFELDDELAPGGRASQPDGRHGRFRARTDKAHLLDGGIACDDSFGQVGFDRS